MAGAGSSCRDAHCKVRFVQRLEAVPSRRQGTDLRSRSRSRGRHQGCHALWWARNPHSWRERVVAQAAVCRHVSGLRRIAGRCRFTSTVWRWVPLLPVRLRDRDDQGSSQIAHGRIGVVHRGLSRNGAACSCLITASAWFITEPFGLQNGYWRPEDPGRRPKKYALCYRRSVIHAEVRGGKGPVRIAEVARQVRQGRYGPQFQVALPGGSG